MSSQTFTALICFYIPPTKYDNRVLVCIWLKDKSHNIYMLPTTSHKHNEERGHLCVDKQLSVGLLTFATFSR